MCTVMDRVGWGGVGQGEVSEKCLIRVSVIQGDSTERVGVCNVAWHVNDCSPLSSVGSTPYLHEGDT